MQASRGKDQAGGERHIFLPQVSEMISSFRSFIRVPLLVTAITMAIVMPVVSGCENEKGASIETHPGLELRYDFIPPPKPEPVVPEPAPASPDDASLEMTHLLSALDINREFAHLSTLAADEYQGRETGTA